MSTMAEYAARENASMKRRAAVGGGLPKMISTPEDVRVMRDLISQACDAYAVTKEDILGPRRLGHLTDARMAIVVAARSLGLSHAKIGRIMNMHHTSIMHLERRANK